MLPLVTAYTLGPTVEVIERRAGWTAVERAFRDSGLPIEVIDERRVFIPYAAEAALIEHAARGTGEANLGLFIAREFPFADLGIYGRYAAMAPDLGSALARALRGIRYATNSGKFDMQVLGDRARITYDSGIQRITGSRHIHGGAVLLVIDLIRRFAGPKWTPIQIELDQSNDADAKNLEQLFDAPVLFNCPRPAVVFETQLLGQPNLRPAPVHEQLTFGDLKQMIRSGPAPDLRFAVRALLQLRLLEGQTDIERTAQTLKIGPRTLQRRLRKEGVSYRDLVENVRLHRAAALLSETSERVVDVALALGYSSPGHFIRAFRRWTSDTPAAYRSRNLMNV